jgi:hypothetical protein
MLLAAYALLICAAVAPQTTAKDAQRRTPLIPASAAGSSAAPQQPPAPPQPLPPTGNLRLGGDPAFAEPPVDPGVGPRPLPTHEPAPFATVRPLFEINGVPLTSGELNELVTYYRSFRPGSADLLLMDAFAALLPAKVMRSQFAAELPAMHAEIEAARTSLAAGRPFAEVVKEFSDDGEAEDPEAQYTFARERAVQPFDRVSFTAEPGSGLHGPHLTVYGWHLIEPLAYERGATPREDHATMRHLLVMYPRLVDVEKNGGDVRAWIREQVAGARIRVLEPGLANLVPPERRAQIVP